VPPWPEELDFATHADALGLASVWVCDHFDSRPPGNPPEGIHAGWTILAALAAGTTRIEVGSLVIVRLLSHSRVARENGCER
jgi:alkanesulfonate monooxygenase SsuD/methylene tetrahydromethanopterin reductase-like flavin-dependent oxidoreductase (luciferase family)